MLRRSLSVSLFLGSLLFLFSLPAPAQELLSARIERYVSGLETKLGEARTKNDQQRVRELTSLIAEQKIRLNGAREAEQAQPAVSPAQADDSSLVELKEEMNQALAVLKSQIDGVKKDNSDARVSGLIRFQWTKGLESAAKTPNSFDITRAYLTFRKKIAANAAARITLDVDRISAAGSSRQNLFDYIKYALVDLPVSLPAGTPVSLTGILGLQHTCWIDWAGKMWRFENIRSAFADVHKNSISSSADFGLGAKGNISLPAAPNISYHATVLNGNGYRSGENNSAKDIALRLNSDIIKTDFGTVVLGAYTGMKNALFNTSGSSESTQTGFLLGLKNAEYGNLYLETQTDKKSGKDVSGYSLGGFLYPAPAILPGAGLLARYDLYDEDTSRTDRQTKTTVLGVFYDWGKNVALSLDLTSSQRRTDAEVKTAALRAQVSF